MKLLSLLLFSSILWLQPASVSEEGKASFYSDKLHGRRTASGQLYNKNLYTAAHATLPFNTVVAVTNLHNSKVVYVRINDRIPLNHHKIIDLSKAAARDLNMIGEGRVQVSLRAVSEQEAALYRNSDSITYLPFKPVTI